MSNIDVCDTTLFSLHRGRAYRLCKPYVGKYVSLSAGEILTYTGRKTSHGYEFRDSNDIPHVIYNPEEYFSMKTSGNSARFNIIESLLSQRKEADFLSEAASAAKAPKEFHIRKGVLIAYRGANPDIVIPDKVTVIGQAACSGDVGTNLKSVAIPKTVTKFERWAFANSHFKSIDIPDSVTEIENLCFEYCYHLETVRLPRNLKTIATRVFYDCKSLKDILIPNGVTHIKYEAFNGCTSLDSIIIPKSVTSIGKGAFAKCTSLRKVVIQSDKCVIDATAFEGTPFSKTPEFQKLSDKYTISKETVY